MGKNEFKQISNVLQRLKDLSKDEALVLLKMIQKGGIINANDVSDIIDSEGLSNSASRPYQILKNLKSKGVVFENANSIIKSYQTIHPRHLLNELKENWKDIGEEVALLEQQRETPNYEEEDPANESFVIKTENLLITTINDLIQEGYNLEVCLKERDKDSEKLKKKIEKYQGNCLGILKGKECVVLFENKEKHKWGVIWLCKKPNKTGEYSFFGNKIVDKNIYQFIKKEVKA